MDYPQKVTKTLYDNNGFIADDFNDPEMREMYDDLKVNRLQYEELFRNFGCTLRFEDKCFYLTRTKVTRQAIESRMEDYYLWIDIVDFLYDVIPSVAPGSRFYYSDLFKKVETSVNLPKKLMSIPLKLKKGTVPDTKAYMEELLDFLKKKQEGLCQEYNAKERGGEII